jgi:MinD-like ATPase involved in chromosome partitioning or flagellar assembly
MMPGMLVVVVSAKGSPGVTTLGLGLAARWPHPDAVLVEADPAGGDLSARFGLPHEPGLAAMALAARHRSEQQDPAEWLQQLPCGVAVVLAPPGAAARASVSALASRGVPLLKQLAAERAVVVDAGRWEPESPAGPLLAAADVVLLLVRPSLEEIGQAQTRARALRQQAGDVRLVLAAGRGRWPAGEVAAAVGLAPAGGPSVGVLPDDPRGAGVLAGRLVPRRGWGRSGWSSWTRLPLLRACHSLARWLDSSVNVPPPPVAVTAKATSDAPTPSAPTTERVDRQEVRS